MLKRLLRIGGLVAWLRRWSWLCEFVKIKIVCLSGSAVSFTPIYLKAKRMRRWTWRNTTPTCQPRDVCVCAHRCEAPLAGEYRYGQNIQRGRVLRVRRVRVRVRFTDRVNFGVRFLNRVRVWILRLRLDWPKKVVFGFWTVTGHFFWFLMGYFGVLIRLILMVSEKRWDFGPIWGGNIQTKI